MTEEGRSTFAPDDIDAQVDETGDGSALAR